MAGPIELVIVLGAFGLIGTFLCIASRFIRESELATPECQPAPTKTTPNGLSKKIHAHAH